MVNIALEIIDALLVIAFIITIYFTNVRKPGSWWKAALVALVLGAVSGGALSMLFPYFDADFFPILMSAFFAVCVRSIIIHEHKKKMHAQHARRH